MSLGKTSREVTAMRRVLAEARSWEPTSKSKGTTPITDVIRFKQNYNFYNNVTGNIFPEPSPPPPPVGDGIWYPATGGAFPTGQLGGTGICYNIAYDGTSTWVAVGIGSNFDDNIWYSTTGMDWTLASGGAFYISGGATPTDPGIDIAYHQGLWVAVGACVVSNIWYSSNASNWLLNSNQIGDGIPFENGAGKKITYGDGYWVAVGRDCNQQNIWYSSNASNWLTTNITDPISNKPFYRSKGGFTRFDVKFNGSKWVAVGQGTGGSNIWITTTANLNNWSNVTPLAFGSNQCTSVAFNGSTWVATGVAPSFQEALSKIWYSTDDAQTWIEASNVPFNNGNGPLKVVYADGKWVAVGVGYNQTENIWYSSNARDWTLASGDPFNSIPGPGPSVTAGVSVAYGNNSWVAVGNGANSNQNIWQSTDGTAWFSASGGAFGYPGTARAVLYSGGKWVAGGGNGLWYMIP